MQGLTQVGSIHGKQGVDGIRGQLLPPTHIRSSHCSATEHPLLPEFLCVDELGPSYISEVTFVNLAALLSSSYSCFHFLSACL